MPFGLWDEAIESLEALGDFKIIEGRDFPDKAIECPEWPAEFEARDFQTAAVESVFRGGIGNLHGIVRSPIRSGKTIIQARIAHKHGRRCVVLVGSKSALQQTYKVFRKVFGRGEVGVFGDGKRSARPITIASVQSSSFDKREAEALFKDVSLLLIDEFHHYTKGKKGKGWRSFVEGLDVPYKVGFSGTIYLDEREVNEEDIWLRAIAGPIVYSISMRRLIELGYLVEPTVFFLPFKGRIEAPNYQEAFKELLNHPFRNRKIVDAAEVCSAARKKVIVVTSRIEQAKAIGELLKARKVKHAVLTGPVELWERRKAYDSFCDPDSDLCVLVGTVFNETVDLPPAEIVINASGGASRGSTIQKLRNMTAHEGKETAFVLDFADVNHKDFRKHSKQRLKHYRAEGLKCRLLRGSFEEALC